MRQYSKTKTELDEIVKRLAANRARSERIRQTVAETENKNKSEAAQLKSKKEASAAPGKKILTKNSN